MNPYTTRLSCVSVLGSFVSVSSIGQILTIQYDVCEHLIAAFIGTKGIDDL